MKRKIILLHHMIACTIRRKVILFTEKDFVELSSQLLPKLDQDNRAEFLYAVFREVPRGMSKRFYRKLEARFSEKILAEMAKSIYGNYDGFSGYYDFKSKEAQKYIFDFLEAHKLSTGVSDFDVLSIDNNGSEDSVITLYNLNKKSIVDRLLNRSGREISKYSILKSAIKTINGATFRNEFSIITEGSEYRFTPMGVCKH